MCFFLYCYGVHRDLHSFPTRRSSDLVHVEALGDLRVVAAEFGAGVPQQFALELVAQVGLELVLAAVRSEERRVGKECRSWWWAVEYKEKVRGAEGSLV